MNNKMFISICILLLGVFISAISQVMLKKSALKEHQTKIKEYMNPLVILSYIMFFGATLLSVYAYKEVPLSFGPVLEATSYIYITCFGVKIFKEKLDVKKIISLLLIIIGIAIYALLG